MQRMQYMISSRKIKTNWKIHLSLLNLLILKDSNYILKLMSY
nr:MAG TPA: hypothetical protein [Caudoviricetes sp.]